MVNYVFEEEIELINELVLKISDEEDEFEVRRPDDVRFIIDFVIERFGSDLYKKALAYCVGIIVTHPFKNGNHRTSMICAEHFLSKNNFPSLTTDEKDKELYKWRIDLEKRDDENLIRRFFSITNIENDEERKDRMESIMDSEYGLGIDKWLKQNYR